MKILVINPVGHPKWDEQDRKLFLSFASPGTDVDVVSLPKGPPSVESPKAHAEVIPLVVERALELHRGYDAIIVNCFLDPAVDLLKGMLKKPVVGPCEASLALASMLSKKIAVVTVGNEALWMIEERVRALGYGDYLVSLKGIELTVLQLDESPEETRSAVVKKAAEAVREGAEVVVLGCTGLSGLAKSVQEAVNRPVIDPSGAALKIAEAMVKLGVFTPKAT
ncbi:MAG: aspartate/glutamate racemase family protein [Desulfurococcales archaeon]|nr:aspartate/glutamate racemase family protein [Desulfurococcales archaeon]